MAQRFIITVSEKFAYLVQAFVSLLLCVSVCLSVLCTKLRCTSGILFGDVIFTFLELPN